MAWLDMKWEYWSVFFLNTCCVQNFKLDGVGNWSKQERDLQVLEYTITVPKDFTG